MNKKMAALAHKFQIKLAQEALSTSPMSQQNDVGGSDTQLQQTGAEIVQNLIKTLGLKTTSPNDFQFTELRMTTNPNTQKPYISWKMSVSPAIAPQFNAAVAQQRQMKGSFSVPRIVTEGLNQAFPDAYVAAAQPLAIG